MQVEVSLFGYNYSDPDDLCHILLFCDLDVLYVQKSYNYEWDSEKIWSVASTRGKDIKYKNLK